MSHLDAIMSCTLPEGDMVRRVAFLRSWITKLDRMRELVPLLSTDNLDGQDLLHATAINAHASKALASLAMAAEDTTLLLAETRHRAQLGTRPPTGPVSA